MTVTGPDTVTVTGLPTEKVVAALAAGRVPFAEISAYRVSLEEAYLELTADAVEFRAAAGGGAMSAGTMAPRRADATGRAQCGQTGGSGCCCGRSGPSSGPCAGGLSG